MTGVLDVIAEWVQRVLAVLPPDTATMLSFPAFALVVVIGSVVFIRRIVPPLCRLAATMTGWAITLVGALLLLVEMALATGFRQFGAKPPAVLYHAGDSVASWAAGLTTGARTVAAGAARVARLNAAVVILLVAGWIWLWNYTHCPDPGATCTRPVANWYAEVQKQ